jgi:Tfp pilus assembly protein PilO
MKSTIQKFPKWQIPILLGIAVIVTVLYLVHIPITVAIVKESVSVFNNQKAIRHALEYSEQLVKIQKDIVILDSLLGSLKARKQSEHKNIVESLYMYADSAGLKTSKVEIGEPIQVEQHHEVAVTVKGRGPYESIGKFVETIENAHQQVRIRDMVINGAEERILAASIEFVIIE